MHNPGGSNVQRSPVMHMKSRVGSRLVHVEGRLISRPTPELNHLLLF